MSVLVSVCVSHLSRGQLSPIAVREASVILLQPDTQRICSLWHPLHRLTKPSSVICWDGHTGQMTKRWGQDWDINISPPRSEYLPYWARLHIDGGEFRAVLLKVFQCAIFQLESLKNYFITYFFIDLCADVYANKIHSSAIIINSGRTRAPKMECNNTCTMTILSWHGKKTSSVTDTKNII